ncbi:MAG: hypothetical protein Q8O79_02875 [Pseudomonadota bacterium]|nr:hypothetical protein [Pseudomonadota bacterium]
MNKEQIKKLSDTLTIMAYGQFGVFGYEAFKRDTWSVLALSVLAFVLLQGSAVWILKFPRGDKS